MGVPAIAVAAEQATAVAETALATFLSREERRTYRAVRSDRRADWLAARVALKEAYRLSIPGSSYQEATIAYHASGAPGLVGREDLCCSIAHSAGAGLAAVARWPVGVDLERLRAHSERLFAHVALADELRYLSELAADADEALVLVWTVKEAVLKGLGRGLRLAPRSLRLTGHAANGVRVELSAAESAFRSWIVHARLDRSFAIAIAVPEEHDGELGYSWYQPHRV